MLLIDEVNAELLVIKEISKFKYSLKFNTDILTKPLKHKWGYYQSLAEITSLLDRADHFKTSRLALYHIVNRKDTIADQLSFYEYLNKNSCCVFLIIFE